jgi:hypothetical protein
MIINICQVNFLLRNLTVIILSFLCLVNTAHAIGIGIAPATVNFTNVLRGGYGEETMRVTNPNNFSIAVSLGTEGLVGDWLLFAPKTSETIILTSGQIVTMAFETFTVPPESSYEFRAVVQPPEDMPAGTYSGYINIDSSPMTNISIPGTGTAVITGAKLKAFVSITGEQILDYVVHGIVIKDTEEGYPIELTVSGENKGNVRVLPKVNVDVWNIDKTELVISEKLTGDYVLPTRKDTQEFSISSENLSVGQYWANVSVFVGDDMIYQELLTFDFLEEGSLKIKGEFIGIINKVWASIGELIKIDAIFQNTGELPTSAKYKGEVYLDEEIMAVLESDELLAPVGETVNLTAYFTPQKAGRYVVRGAIYYDKKVTFTKEGIINVLPDESIMALVSNNLLYIVIIILLFIIIVKLMPRKGSDYLSTKYKKLDEKLDKTIKDGEELHKRIRESKEKLRK